MVINENVMNANFDSLLPNQWFSIFLLSWPIFVLKIFPWPFTEVSANVLKKKGYRVGVRDFSPLVRPSPIEKGHRIGMQTDFAQIKLFLTKIFQTALWPSAKCSMAHWLKTTVLNPKLLGHVSATNCGSEAKYE